MLPVMDISPVSSDSSLLPPLSAFQMPNIPKPPYPDQAPSEASTPPRPSRWGNLSELSAPTSLHAAREVPFQATRLPSSDADTKAPV